MNEIADTLDKSRKTISTFLSTQIGFKEEKERRKVENQKKRAGYKRDWEKKNRQGSIDGYLLKRQHEIDVRVLSSEKY